MRYDPDHEPDRASWFGLDEGERIALVAEYPADDHHLAITPDDESVHDQFAELAHVSAVLGTHEAGGLTVI